MPQLADVSIEGRDKHPPQKRCWSCYPAFFSKLVFLRMSSPLGITLALTSAIALAAAVAAVAAVAVVVVPHDAWEQRSDRVAMRSVMWTFLEEFNDLMSVSSRIYVLRMEVMEVIEFMQLLNLSWFFDFHMMSSGFGGSLILRHP